MISSSLVVGGGAAGFFAAVTAAEAGASVVLLERGREVLAKVRISGGGRCNVTNACFEPKQLVRHYPRGGRELLGPFHHFQSRDTMAWFRKRGVDLKIESDGRVFPVSDQSQTIIDALRRAARKANVQVQTGVALAEINRDADGFCAKQGDALWRGERLLLATGSGAQGYVWARQFGHSIVPPVPSLFTFAISDPRLNGLSGIAVENAELTLLEQDKSQSGPLLVTHWGLSGPAVLKLSAWGARELSAGGYKATLQVNWLGLPSEDVLRRLSEMRTVAARNSLGARMAFPLPQRLWERLLGAAGVGEGRRWADLTAVESGRLAGELTAGRFAISGKGAFKEEFVTAGGVSLNEVNFSTMESRLCPGLHFAGEILDIDGVTGGFNFQSAWTTGWLAGRALAKGR
ncbi:MAG: aminoacetone oxidase family FAD-binding enzyme [Elusimicrobia bacterium]|nr:aminoacetone oxidase family FAD-binding enzyme [Elusimicrobiota bacterium]